MQNILFLFVCIVIGMLIKKYITKDDDSHLLLNQILIYVCLPAITLLHTTETAFDVHYLLPMLMPWLSFGCSFLFFQWLDSYIHFHPHTKAVLILTAGIPSVSFVGFPIFEMLYGKTGLEIGILMSQSGSFLVCSTLGVMVAAYYAAEVPSVKKMLIGVLTFPTFAVFCVAVLLNLLGFHLNSTFKDILEKLASPFGFLALVSVGMQVPTSTDGWQVKNLKWGLAYKLLITPLLIFILYGIVLAKKGIILEMSVLGAALGPMNTIAIIATNYKLNPTLASQMVGIGIPISLVTIGILNEILHLF